MSTLLLDLNDLALRWRPNDEIVDTPAWALIGEPPLIGRSALSEARLQPRRINNQFWHHLDTNPIAGAAGVVRHHADLAFLQLKDIHLAAKADAYVISVPAHYERAQLSLLLGLAAATSMRIKAVADPGILLANSVDSEAPALLYLDAGLHDVSLTVISNGQQWQRQQSVTAHTKGLLSVIDRLANQIAKQLIQTERFDPLHLAATEQQLFEQLFEHLESQNLGTSSTIQLIHEDRRYEHTLTEAALRNGTVDMVPDIIKCIQTNTASTAELLVSHRAALLPGLLEAMALIPSVQVTRLTDSALFEAFDQALPTLLESQDFNQLIYQLPKTQRPSNRPASDTESPTITHVLFNGRAIPIDDYRAMPSVTLVLEFVASGDWILKPGSEPLTLNQQALTQQRTLSIGDRVTLGAQTFEFIQVL